MGVAVRLVAEMPFRVHAPSRSCHAHTGHSLSAAGLPPCRTCSPTVCSSVKVQRTAVPGLDVPFREEGPGGVLSGNQVGCASPRTGQVGHSPIENVVPAGGFTVPLMQTGCRRHAVGCGSLTRSWVVLGAARPGPSDAAPNLVSSAVRKCHRKHVKILASSAESVGKWWLRQLA